MTMLFLGFFDLPLWMLLTISCLLLLYRYSTGPGDTWKSLGIPSPPSLPFVGHMVHIFYSQNGLRGNIANWTKRHGKIFGILFFRRPMLIVTDLEAVEEILVKNFHDYSSRFGGGDGLYRPVITKGLLLNRGRDWKRVRHVLSPNFTACKLKTFTGIINATAKKLVEALERRVKAGHRPDAKAVFSAYSLDVMAAVAYGLDLDSQNNLNGPFYKHAKGLLTFRKSLQLIMAALGVFPFLGRWLRALDIGFFNSGDVQFFREQFTRLLSQRIADGKVGGGDGDEEVDVLQSMINFESNSKKDNNNMAEDKKLTVEEIVAQGIVFVIVGYENSSSTLQWLSYQLSKHKDVQDRIRREIQDVVGDGADVEISYEHCQRLKYVEAVIREVLRMYPPVVTLTRESGDTTTAVKGVTVPARTAILIPVYNVCRDPDVFENPDTFNPDRFTDETKPVSNLVSMLPFGFGPRQCLAPGLAMLQIKIGLVHLLRRFSIDDATPHHVDIDDTTALLTPRQPIHLVLTKTECK